MMDVFVAWLDGSVGKVLGAFASQVEAEAAIGRAQMAGDLNYDGAPQPEVLEFEMKAEPVGDDQRYIFSLESEKQRQLDLIHELRKVADTQERRAEMAEGERDEWRKSATRAQQAYEEVGEPCGHYKTLERVRALADKWEGWDPASPEAAAGLMLREVLNGRG